ncbi:nucleoporin interacting component (Nup93/Nic96-like) family protein [Actinidia rufa]|uniref:Nuclear pore protein n=1 Tax=Actinidia rufa TaxID=165716 RepID=A0A7J0DKQ8_9ERIC|nr:nucleoporin interacting component (Nup93/Nic96-like) family protein [Actinidia rufa]
MLPLGLNPKPQDLLCLRTGYYDEARNVAASSRVSHHFAAQLSEWIATGGMVSPETAASASEECEKLRIGDRVGRAAYDEKKLLLYAIISVLDDGYSPDSLDDLQVYLNKFEPSYYTKNGKDPLVYPYVLLLGIQLLPAVLYLSKDMGDEGYSIDAVHISIVLADHGILSANAGAGQTLGVMDAFAEASSIIRQYGSVYLRPDNLSIALEYYAHAAAAEGGGQLS